MADRRTRRLRTHRRRVSVRRRRLVAGLIAVGLAVVVVGGFAGRGTTAVEAVTPTTGLTDVAQTTTTATETPAVAKPALPARLGSGKKVTFAFGGDVHFEPPIRSYLDGNPNVLLADIAPWLKRADIAMVNLETAITSRGDAVPGKGYNFRGPPSGLRALKAGGVDVVSLANNHGLDYGVTGLRDTLAASRAVGLPVIGAGMNERQAYRPYRVEVNGQRIAIIAASQVIDDNLVASWVAKGSQPGMATAKEPARLLREVRQARRSSDTVVVYLHWGSELVPCPTDRQKAIARDLVRAGADMVVGTHAHIPLGAGKMGTALVAYGLGNFVFYASREDNTRTGVLEVTATGRRIDSYRWRPARIRGGRPVPVVGEERQRLLRDWSGLRGCTGLRP